jgi:hypothetical protein
MNAMSSILPALLFLLGLVLAVVEGRRRGRQLGRWDERRQVVAFLHGGFRQSERVDPGEIAGRVANGDHLAYDFKLKPPRLGGA